MLETLPYPKFEDLKKEMMEQYDTCGKNIEEVLEQVCPKYRLHVSKVTFQKDLYAVAKEQPVLATFHLNTLSKCPDEMHPGGFFGQ